MSKRLFRIAPVGNLGNQMMQLMLAHTLRVRLGELNIVGYDMPLWGLTQPDNAPGASGSVEIRGQLIDVDHLATLMRIGLLRDARLIGIGSRMSNYLPPQQYQALFPSGRIEVEHHGDDELLISVRGAEILGQCHRDYGPIPPSFYQQLVHETGLRPVLFGQIEDDWYSQLLIEALPQARVIRSVGILADFERLRSARHVAISISSFAWLAAWMSDARTIHVPMLGLLNPAQRPDIDLLPLHDPRYRFYGFPVRHWNGQTEDVDALRQPAKYEVMSTQSVATVLRRALATTRAERFEVAVKNPVKALLSCVRG